LAQKGTLWCQQAGGIGEEDVQITAENVTVATSAQLFSAVKGNAFKEWIIRVVAENHAVMKLMSFKGTILFSEGAIL